MAMPRLPEKKSNLNIGFESKSHTHATVHYCTFEPFSARYLCTTFGSLYVQVVTVAALATALTNASS